MQSNLFITIEISNLILNKILPGLVLFVYSIQFNLWHLYSAPIANNSAMLNINEKKHLSNTHRVLKLEITYYVFWNFILGTWIAIKCLKTRTYFIFTWYVGFFLDNLI